MRLNQFIARSTGMSRRKADQAIIDGRVTINEHTAHIGAQVQPDDSVALDGRTVTAAVEIEICTIMLHKPVGYVCSRDGQGSKTIYDLLPENLKLLKPVGRLDKDSSGLLLLTNDGQLAQKLTHPSFTKVKVYEVVLDKELLKTDECVLQKGVKLKDGLSRLQLMQLNDRLHWQVSMHEGRNRQIRRTFASRGYIVTDLHRTHFGDYSLGDLPSGSYRKT